MNDPEEDTLYETKQPKEHGIMRQIMNPGGDKYDEAAYGQNATTNPRAGNSKFSPSRTFMTRY